MGASRGALLRNRYRRINTPLWSMDMKIATIVAFACIVLLMGCQPETPQAPIDVKYDRSGTTLEITTVFYDSRMDLTAAYMRFYPKTDPEYARRVLGFSQWRQTLGGDPADNQCVVHTVRPKYIDDDTVMTLGHEVLHCIYGSYHAK